jgi:hypothetical protein
MSHRTTLPTRISSMDHLEDLNSFFWDFHFYEKYDDNKIYCLDPFQYNYGHGELIYRYILYIFVGEDTAERYIIAEEIVNDIGLQKLSKYCH